jgi:Tfp pilus assembly protein PilO
MTLRKLNLIVVGGVVFLTGLFVAALFMPRTNHLKQVREEASRRSQAVRAEQEKIGNVSEIYAAILEMDRRREDNRCKLPVQRQFGEFLKALSDRLVLAGIEENVVRQKPEFRLDDDRLPPELKRARGAGLLPVHVAFDSAPNQFFDFLKSIESLPRLSHVETLVVANDETNPGRVHAEITLHTFYHPEGSADTAAPARAQ